MAIYMYIYTCICIYVHLYMYIFMYIYACICIYRVPRVAWRQGSVASGLTVAELTKAKLPLVDPYADRPGSGDAFR